MAFKVAMMCVTQKERVKTTATAYACKKYLHYENVIIE